MAEIQIIVPEVGEAGMDLTFVDWLCEVGATVQEGADLFEVDTEKTTIAVEAIETGILKSVEVQAGDTVIARQVIGVLDAGVGSP